ncbi:MAG: ABC transporter permease [Xanthobacteraceae bacterium]
MAVQAVDTPSPAMPRDARSNLERPGVLRRYPQFTISPAILVALIAAWWLATDVAGVPAYVMPPPEQVLHALIGGLSRAPWDRAGYWYHAGITVWEALLGFAIGSALGAVLGLLLSHWPLLGKSWYPYIVGFQSLPKVALAPLMVVWFGFGLEGKVFITAIITFFPVLVNMMAGYQAVEPERIELARSCNASELHLLTKIVIPSCLPFLFAGLGVASVLSILGAVVGEFVGASAGLGMLLMQYNQAMEISPMFAVILLLAVIGFLMNYAVTLIERRYCFWAQRSNATGRP